MNITDILDTMDELLDKAWGLPLSGGKCVIDVEQLHELLGDIRLNMPAEIKQAKLIVQDRKQIIEDANAEAEIIVRQAQERAKRMVNQEEIIKQAQTKANEMVSQAQSQSRELKKATNTFVDGMLKQMEEQLAKDLAEIKET
ncbi:MAG: hypothetical protein K0R90_1731, partial [Oscillospiraceae bacterium]|nr:hypothetical protein [Oscillospiraceae bacterium]